MRSSEIVYVRISTAQRKIAVDTIIPRKQTSHVCTGLHSEKCAEPPNGLDGSNRQGIAKTRIVRIYKIVYIDVVETHFEEAEVYESDPDQVIQTTVVAGEEWPNMKYFQILIGSDPDDPVISEVPEQLELRPAQPYIDPSDETQDSAQHDNDDSANRLSTIPGEDSQASYLAGLEQGPPDEIEFDG